MRPDITRKYDLTISTDKVMVYIRPPGFVTLFLSLIGNVTYMQYFKEMRNDVEWMTIVDNFP